MNRQIQSRLSALEAKPHAVAPQFTRRQWAALPNDDVRFLAGLPDDRARLDALPEDIQIKAWAILDRLAAFPR